MRRRTATKGITVAPGCDAVYEVRPEDVASILAVAPRDRLRALRAVGRHAGHPDDFEDVDIVVYPNWPDPLQDGWLDLFEHAEQLLEERGGAS